MISTKEDFIITLLAQGAEEFVNNFIDGNISNNEEIKEAVIDLENPQIAFWYAWKFKSPSDEIKKICCKYSVSAFLYARNVVGAPCNETRTAACQNPIIADMYAKGVDRKPTEETRQAASECSGTKKEYEKWEDSLKKK